MRFGSLSHILFLINSQVGLGFRIKGLGGFRVWGLGGFGFCGFGFRGFGV